MDIPKPKYGYFKGSIDECLYAEKAKDLAGWVKKENKMALLSDLLEVPHVRIFLLQGKIKVRMGRMVSYHKVMWI